MFALRQNFLRFGVLWVLFRVCSSGFGGLVFVLFYSCAAF